MPNAPYITEREVLGMFVEGLEQSTGLSWVESICTPPIESDQDSETYAWLGQSPQMSVLTGDKRFDQLRASKWAVDNVPYQGGLTIPKNHVLYDKTGQVRMRVDDLAGRTMAHWVSLVAPLLVNGESTACYDDQFFFDTDHSEGDSGTQSNDVSADISGYPVANAGTTTQPSAGEMIFSIMEGIEAILGFKDDKGEYVNEDKTEFLVAAGIPLLTNVLLALRAGKVDGGDSNLIMEQDSFRFRFAPTPRLNSWTTKFAVFATQGTQKPIIRQQRMPNNAGSGVDVNGIEFNTIWLDSEHCKKSNECLVSVETERAAAYGDWKKACLVTMA